MVQSTESTRSAASPARPLAGQKIRIAVIGCGAVSREMHMPVLSGHEGVEITALVDRDLERARALAREYKIRTVLSDAAELTRDLADAVIICTPPAHHAPATVELAGRGFHILVEKPIATRYEDARNAVAAADQAGVVLSVPVFRRLLPATRLMRGLIDSGLLGRPVSFDVEEGGVYDWPAATLANMKKESAGGGVLIDFGSHTVDRLLTFFDGPGEILDYRDNNRGGGVESDCELRLRFSHAGHPIDGRVELSRTRNLRNSFRVQCEQGTLELDSNERFTVRVIPDKGSGADPATGEQRAYELSAGWAKEPPTPWFESIRAQIDDWLGAIRTGRQPLLAASTILPSLKIITDCYAREPRLYPEPGIDARLIAHAGHGPARRVLVTGATGFIGGRLCEVLSLRDGWKVRALVHNPARASRLAGLPVEMVVGEVSGSADASKLVEGCDAVVHCAFGKTWGNTRKIVDVTVGGTRQLALAARAAGVERFVHISTFAVHDLTKEGVIDEGAAICRQKSDAGSTIYAATKADAEDVIRQEATAGLSAMIIRLPNVYGPYSTIFTIGPLEALQRGPVLLMGPADRLPSNTVHVDNVVEAIAYGLAAPDPVVRGETFLLGGESQLTWADYFACFSRELGIYPRVLSDEELALRPRPGFNLQQWLATPFRGGVLLFRSGESQAFARRVAETKPLHYLVGGGVGLLPDRARKRFGKILGVGPRIYMRDRDRSAVTEIEFGLTRPGINSSKIEKVLGYRPAVERDRAMAETLEWARHARILPARIGR